MNRTLQKAVTALESMTRDRLDIVGRELRAEIAAITYNVRTQAKDAIGLLIAITSGTEEEKAHEAYRMLCDDYNGPIILTVYAYQYGIDLTRCDTEQATIDYLWDFAEEHGFDLPIDPEAKHTWGEVDYAFNHAPVDAWFDWNWLMYIPKAGQR